jgi:outer membrane protein TolC
VASEIRHAMAGLPATILRQDDEDFEVVVRVAPEGRESITDLDRVRIPVAGGAPVPLAQLTRPELSSTYAQIEHTDLSRSIIIGSDVDGRLAADIVRELLPTVEALPLNGQERFEVIGEDEERDRAFLSMLQNVVLAMGLIYGILVLQFRSFQTPMVIFTSIPVALAGSVIGLLVGGWPFGFTAFTGLLALIGIVVNDAIVLVDRVNQLRRGGASLADAIREGGASRLQPIVLTTLTTIAGLLPLTLTGGSMWGPMGWVIIGGLIAATTVTLVMVPAMYVLLERGRESTRTRDIGTVAPQPVATVLATVLFLGVAAVPAAAQIEVDTMRVDLGELLEMVDEANPDLAAARQNVAAAEARVREAKSARWPTLNLDADLSRTNDPARTFGLTLQSAADPSDLFAFDPGAEVDVLGGSAGLQWLLFDFSRGPLIDAARSLAEASDADFGEVRASLHLAATVELFLIRRLVDEYDVTVRALGSIAKELADAQQRERAGRGLAADVLGLQARQAELETRRIAVGGAIKVAESRLAELLSLTPDQVLRPVPGLSVRDSGFSTPDEAVAAASANRDERRAAAARTRAADATIDAAGGVRWPSLVAQGELNYVVPDVDFDLGTDNYAVGLGLRWSPFQGGAVSARKDEARARRAAAGHAERSVELRLRREVWDAWIELETAIAATRSATLQRDAAAESFRVVRLRFEEGRDTLTRYLQAELTLFEAESTLVRAQALEQTARAGLIRAVGERIDGGGVQ